MKRYLFIIFMLWQLHMKYVIFSWILWLIFYITKEGSLFLDIKECCRKGMHIKVLIKTMTNRWRISKLLKNDNLIWMMDHHYFVSFGNQWRLVKVLKTVWTIIKYYCKVIILSVEFILMKCGLHFLNQTRAY